MPRHGHRKIETWTWRKAGVKKIEIPVYLETGEHSQYFSVTLDDLNIHKQDSDITKLKREVFALLEEKHEIRWERFFFVKYQGRHPALIKGEDGVYRVQSWEEHCEHYRLEELEDGLGGRMDFDVTTKIKLAIEEIDLGTYPNGERCWRAHGCSQIGSGLPALKVVQDRGGYRSDWDYDLQAIIPYSDENRRALHELLRAFAALDLKLMELLKQDQLQATLTKILKGSGLLALPAPAPHSKPAQPIKIVSEMQEHYLMEEERKKKRRKR